LFAELLGLPHPLLLLQMALGLAPIRLVERTFVLFSILPDAFCHLGRLRSCPAAGRKDRFRCQARRTLPNALPPSLPARPARNRYREPVRTAPEDRCLSASLPPERFQLSVLR